VSRFVNEWIPANDDQAIPPRIKIKIFDKHGGHCALCTRKIMGSLRPAYDHRIALINGGKHAESNLQLLCVPCHKEKSRADVAEKSKVARVRAKHIGIKTNRRKIQSAGFKRSEPQHSATRPIEKRT
jgi:5-methylcytosine-specific restriction endonuclease McrA